MLLSNFYPLLWIFVLYCNNARFFRYDLVSLVGYLVGTLDIFVFSLWIFEMFSTASTLSIFVKKIFKNISVSFQRLVFLPLFGNKYLDFNVLYLCFCLEEIFRCLVFMPALLQAVNSIWGNASSQGASNHTTFQRNLSIWSQPLTWISTKIPT